MSSRLQAVNWRAGSAPGESLPMLGDAATTVDGVLLMGLGADMEVPGLALDATGIGAPAEVAMNAAGLVVMAAGGGAALYGLQDGLGRTDTMYNEAQAEAVSSESVAPSGSDGGPGAWKSVKRGGSKASRDYQRKVTGTPEGPDGEMYEYEVNGVHFDGYNAGPPRHCWRPRVGGMTTCSTPTSPETASGQTSATSSVRQLEAAGSAPVTWVFAEDGAAAAVTELLDFNRLPGAVRVIVQRP